MVKHKPHLSKHKGGKDFFGHVYKKIGNCHIYIAGKNQWPIYRTHSHVLIMQFDCEMTSRISFFQMVHSNLGTIYHSPLCSYMYKQTRITRKSVRVMQSPTHADDWFNGEWMWTKAKPSLSKARMPVICRHGVIETIHCRDTVVFDHIF